MVLKSEIPRYRSTAAARLCWQRFVGVGVGFAAALVVGCGESITGPAPVESVSVTIATATMVIGTKTQAVAIVKDGGGNVLDGRTITWTSSDAEVASVSPTGEVTALRTGAAEIKATSEGKSGSATVTVSVPVSEVVVTLRQPGLSVGFSIQASATVKDESGNPVPGQTVTWSSSNTAVATVNQAGVVTGGSAGIADIIATSGGKSASATIVIIVIKPQSLSAGQNHTCAISIEGDAYCWGQNESGQIGDGTTNQARSPVRVAGGLKFSALSARYAGTYALTADGRLFCWGAKCEPGSPTLSPRPVPTKRAIDFLGTGLENSCALHIGHAAYCWGYIGHGQKGDGTTAAFDEYTFVPDARVAGNHAFTDITAGRYHSCALTAAGQAYCWGHGSYLGTGGASNSLVPRPISGNHSFKDIAAGTAHSCAVATSGATYCWGHEATVGVPIDECQVVYGQISPCTEPTAARGSHVYESITGGLYTTCGVTTGGDVYCWGMPPYGHTAISFRYWSALGTPDPYAHVKYRTVAVGMVHVCAISTEGDAYCMNHHAPYGDPPSTYVGLLGDGTTDISREVRKVTGGIKFRTP